MLHRSIWLWLFTFVLVGGSTAYAEPRVALVIGNTHYHGSFDPLRNPGHDAKVMAAALKRAGFSVSLAEDLDAKQMKQAIMSFGDTLSQAGPKVTALLYYAGYGLQIGMDNYLVPVDADIKTVWDADLEAISAHTVLQQMQFAGAARNILILDAGRSARTPRGALQGASLGFAESRSQPIETFVSYSTSMGDLADDGEDNDSPYTAALARFIVMPGLSIHDVFEKVRAEVVTASNGKQIPWDFSSLTRPFYFMSAK